MQKQMYKVLCPIEKKDGGTYWMRLGTAFKNKDDSLNVYLDAVPTKATHLQIREIDDEDLKRRETNRPLPLNPTTAGTAADPIPF